MCVLRELCTPVCRERECELTSCVQSSLGYQVHPKAMSTTGWLKGWEGGVVQKSATKNLRVKTSWEQKPVWKGEAALGMAGCQGQGLRDVVC